jgi:hypothetical protein
MYLYQILLKDRINYLEALKLIHKLIWKDDDLMNQETLFELQDFIDELLIREETRGTCELEVLDNGYIKNITIKKGCAL